MTKLTQDICLHTVSYRLLSFFLFLFPLIYLSMIQIVLNDLNGECISAIWHEMMFKSILDAIIFLGQWIIKFLLLILPLDLNSFILISSPSKLKVQWSGSFSIKFSLLLWHSLFNLIGMWHYAEHTYFKPVENNFTFPLGSSKHFAFLTSSNTILTTGELTLMNRIKSSQASLFKQHFYQGLCHPQEHHHTQLRRYFICSYCGSNFYQQFLVNLTFST